MKIDMNITAKLTPEDVNEIVKDYLERQGYEDESFNQNNVIMRNRGVSFI